MSALTRRKDIPLCEIVNCAPAKRCVWPDIDRHGRGCARGLFCGAIGFYCGVGRSIHARQYGSIAAFCLRFTPAVCRTAPNRTACDRFRFYSAWVEIAIRAFSNVMRLSNLLSSLQACAFLSGDPDGGTESTARQSTFLRKHLVLAMLSAGRTLGLRAPDCAKESSTLWTLFMGFAAKYLLPNLAVIAIFESTHPGSAVTRVHGKT